MPTSTSASGRAMTRGPRDERGSIAVWASVSMVAFIVSVGLGVDFSGHAAAEQEARAVAAEAARAGGQYLESGPGTSPVPNVRMASRAATAYVEASDYTGAVSLDAGTITVRVTGSYETLFLGIIGINSLPLDGVGAASINPVVDGVPN